MERHGEDMMRLVLSVTLLQKERAKALATDIANEPKLTQPIAGGESDLNAALPQQFFTLQDELRSRATSVADATTKADNVALAQALGRMTETCVACHSVYLHRSDETTPVKKEPKP
jgi:mono/diheme cytochrome c family protein